jgi:hypothetical protein
MKLKNIKIQPQALKSISIYNKKQFFHLEICKSLFQLSILVNAIIFCLFMNLSSAKCLEYNQLIHQSVTALPKTKTLFA